MGVDERLGILKIKMFSDVTLKDFMELTGRAIADHGVEGLRVLMDMREANLVVTPREMVAVAAEIRGSQGLLRSVHTAVVVRSAEHRELVEVYTARFASPMETLQVFNGSEGSVEWLLTKP